MDAHLKLPEKFNLVSALVDANIAQGRANHIAICYEDEKLSYSDLRRQISRVGNALKALGIEMENRVAILLPDCPQWVSSFLGAVGIGAVAVPLNTMMKPKDYEYFLNDCRAKVIIVSADLKSNIEAIAHNLNYLKHTVVVGEPGKGQLSYEELVQGAAPELVVAETSHDDAAFWLYTSGSTGPPKGAVHLQHDLAHIPEIVFKQALKITENDRVFSVPRLFFHYGITATAGTFGAGASRIIDAERPRPQRVFEVITRYRPTVFCGVPTLFANLLAVEDTHNYDLSSIRLCLSAGEPLPLGIYRRFKERFGVEILDFIGCTETCAWYIGNRPDRVKPGSTGELIPGYQVKLVDDKGLEIAPGAEGELLIKAGSNAAGYWNKHQRTEEAFWGEWFRSGDLFRQDEEGYFWFMGRIDDIIEAGGIKVVPTEVESTLIEHPAVLEAAVVGAFDEFGLTKPKAFVTLKRGYQPSPELAKELQQFVKDRIAPHNHPRWVEFVVELPKTATGKIQRFKLR